MTRLPSALVVAAALVASVASGCRAGGTKVQSGLTGINLTVQYDPKLSLSALAISGTDGDAPAFPAGTLPNPPRPLTSGQETAALLLRPALAGRTILVRVDGRMGTAVLASEQRAVTIELAKLVDVTLTLGAPAICGDRQVRAGIEQCDDGNVAPGDGCSALCRTEAAGTCGAATCPDGCCAGGVCMARMAATCGTAGGACTACDASADTCSVAGACACGDGAPCGTGQRCLSGACVCDGTSCPNGCCSDGVCLAGDAAATCGIGGLRCQACTSGTCANGICSGCNAASCPGGCCSGSTCYPRSVSACGTGGGACVGCDVDKADTCSMLGACRCGGGPACLAGQRCMNGACVCDGSSCPSGCCQGNVCQSPSLTACGIGGTACAACDPSKANRCGSKGGCECGSGAVCAGGQRCAAGQCICDASSCPSGCCRGATCETRSLLSCGDAGATCAVCDQRADNCSATGTCRCGAGAACVLGQRCVGSTCVCDANSCPNGCCLGDACQAGDNAGSCGAGGNACEMCPVGQACAGGRCSGCSVTCRDGCCAGATCNPPSMATCGTGGALCVGCDAVRADGCSASGTCVCGTGPACPAGLRCQAGSCLCQATSCGAGCCDGAACVTPSFTRCGAAGTACVACNASVSDNCSPTGTCDCGAGPACGAGQRCVAGSCVCDATSCPDGCCTGNTCRAHTLNNCGSNGSACIRCGITANRCSPAGICQCGGNPPCAEGQRCEAGSCVCDGTSCANGCCSGQTCLPGTANTACGSGGGVCHDCGTGPCAGGVCSDCNPSNCQGCCSGLTCSPAGLGACGGGGAACVTCDPGRADNCSMTGGCRCGTGPACLAGTGCVAGTCACDAASCPNGCCANGLCTSPALASCGVGGTACGACAALTADACDAVTGTCRCGNGPACGAGNACVSGVCVCNEASCPNGCCTNGTVCMMSSITNCGTLGASCVTCDPVRADTCAAGGACRCGDRNPCGANKHCVGGTCVCDPLGCPNGCCNANGNCASGNANANCGTGGGACAQCTGATTCQMQACR